MLKLLLAICREYGEKRVLLTCDKTNDASRPVSYTHLDEYKRQVQITVSNGEEFAAELQRQIDRWKAMVISSEISRDTDGLMCYDLTLKTVQSIEVNDLMSFMSEHKEIIRAEGVPIV